MIVNNSQYSSLLGLESWLLCVEYTAAGLSKDILEMSLNTMPRSVTVLPPRIYVGFILDFTTD